MILAGLVALPVVALLLALALRRHRASLSREDDRLHRLLVKRGKALAQQAATMPYNERQALAGVSAQKIREDARRRLEASHGGRVVEARDQFKRRVK